MSLRICVCTTMMLVHWNVGGFRGSEGVGAPSPLLSSTHTHSLTFNLNQQAYDAPPFPPSQSVFTPAQSTIPFLFLSPVQNGLTS